MIMVFNSSSVYKGYPHFSFVQKFERQFDHEKTTRWMRNNCHLSLYFAATYLVLIVALKGFMKNRKPLEIRKIVTIWDFGLAIFSTCGMLRVLPEMFYVLNNFGLEFSMCDSTANSVSYFWGWAFVFSKAVELLDTVLLVLKKQKLTFLHVAHHVLTLLVSWYLSVDVPGGARWMIALNFTIHSVMYTYFALKAVKLNVPREVSMFVTFAQIVQFCVGVLGSLYAVRANILGRPCTTKLHVAIAMTFFCSFLLYLFTNFFIRRYNLLEKEKSKNKSN